MEVGGLLHAVNAQLQEATGYGTEWDLRSFWTFWRRENLLHLPRIRHQFLGRLACTLVSIPIELPWLCHDLIQRELEWHNGEKSRLILCLVWLVAMEVGRSFRKEIQR
jgi:hypothetical protein